MSVAAKGFDIHKTIDNTQSISFQFASLGVKSIFYNSNDKFISADCEVSPSSNVTYVENGQTTEYKARQLYIVGNAGSTKTNQLLGQETHGQLIIKTANANGDKTLFMCFPLKVVNPGPQNTSIDSMIRMATTTNSTTNQLKANFDEDIYSKKVPDTRFVEYTSNKGNKAKVLTFGAPVSIISVYLMSLENNVNLFNIQPDTYSIVTLTAPGEWMECDYVPIDSSEEVATYSLPVGSGLVQENAAYNSLKTMMTYIMFIIFTALSYMMIPYTYTFLLQQVFKYTQTKLDVEREKTMKTFDMGATFTMAFLASLLIIMGATTGYDFSPSMLLYGVIIGILVLLGIIIVNSKKSMNKDWPLNEMEE